MGCLSVSVSDKGEHLRINVSMVCSVSRPRYNYLLDSIGRMLMDSEGRLLTIK